MAAGGFADDAAFAVHRHCGVSLLRAHRIARGHTLVEAVALLKKFLRSHGALSEGLAHQQLSRWENGLDVPTPRYLDALCALYRTRPDRLGFGNDYSDSETTPQPGSDEIVDRRVLANPAATELLASTTGVPDRGRAAMAYLDLLEELTAEAGYVLYTAAPTEFIPARMADLARIKACLMAMRSPSIRRRLYRLFAMNAGFIGIRIIDVASLNDSLEWFGIARRASRAAGEVGMQAWIAGHVCTSCAWYGRFLDPSLAAARMAQSAGGGRPNAAAVFGYLAEAACKLGWPAAQRLWQPSARPIRCSPHFPRLRQ